MKLTIQQLKYIISETINKGIRQRLGGRWVRVSPDNPWGYEWFPLGKNANDSFWENLWKSKPGTEALLDAAKHL